MKGPSFEDSPDNGYPKDRYGMIARNHGNHDAVPAQVIGKAGSEFPIGALDFNASAQTGHES